MSRPLRTSERRLVLLLGDAAAVLLAVLLALWTWSITAGFPYDLAFLRARVVWLLALPVWLVLLIPTRHAATALDSLVLSGESKTHNSTLVACSEKMAKLTPEPSQVAPRGYGEPGRTFTLASAIDSRAGIEESGVWASG